MGRFLRRYGTLAGFVLILIFFSVRLPGTFLTAQFGSTRSINASAAAAIAMHTWIRAHADLGDDAAWRG